MLNYGCSITIRRSTEKRLRPLKRRRRSMRLSISSLGRMKIKLEGLRLREKRN